MKKLVSSIVVALVLAMMGLPLVASSMTRTTHACCLAHGAHHCADSHDGNAEHGFSAQCPYHASTMFFCGVTSLLGTYSATIPVASSSVSQDLTASGSRRNSFQPVGRAPPSFL
jgi:hypothetical protein